jgi:hypothetical protein
VVKGCRATTSEGNHHCYIEPSLERISKREEVREKWARLEPHWSSECEETYYSEVESDRIYKVIWMKQRTGQVICQQRYDGGGNTALKEMGE